jgi:hypothetical protein
MIYHERVPNEGQLTAIPPNDLSNVEPYQRSAELKDVLATLLPLHVHLAASEVTAQASELLRKAEAQVRGRGKGRQTCLRTQPTLIRPPLPPATGRGTERQS